MKMIHKENGIPNYFIPTIGVKDAVLVLEECYQNY